MAPLAVMSIFFFANVCFGSLIQMSKSSSNLSRSMDFDHFVFAQQWPKSICLLQNLSHEHDCTVFKNITSWTIHGLWPTMGKTMQPNFCNNQSRFDVNKLKSIILQMGKLWPNLYRDTHWDSFWEHEWTKHGTCAASVLSLSDELNYFNSTLQLHDKFNLLSILENAGVKPSSKSTYQFEDLQNALGDKSLIMCFYEESTQTQYITAVEICLDKTFEWKKCSDFPRQQMAVPSWGNFNTRSRRSVQDQVLEQPSRHHYREVPCKSTSPIAYLPLTND